MGTKTDDAAVAKGATETADVTEEGGPEGAVAAEEAKGTDLTKESKDAEDAKEPEGADGAVDDADDEDGLDLGAEPAAPAKSTGVGQGAAAVVSAALGVVSLSGGWLGTIASARENLVGQLETSQGAGVAKTIQAMYGDSWKATALIAGIFALAALVIGFVVLVRPAFGAPGKEQAPWIKSVAWAGVALGVIGLVLAMAKYSDLLLGLPSAPS
ncbi:hypothetical protein [Streptomyces luteocolor]|uniref:hypothetical protein n=1 Tax=Streptomyces luteocolor TaxID=285500 RepID=UPI0009A09894|nr:hypothetical protein [Streptomyces luteocolor]